MFETLPKNFIEVLDWPWEKYQSYVDDLISRELSVNNVHQFLADWTRFYEMETEVYVRLYLATSLDTTDESAQRQYHKFLDEIYPQALAAFQQLKEMLLASGLTVNGFEIPLRNMRTEAALFRNDNIPLLSKEQKLITEYEKITGSQTAMWEGEEKTIAQLGPIYQDSDRSVREKAWRLAMERQLKDREVINHLWGQFMDLRLHIAANADQTDFRAYKWQSLLRFAYTPEDCVTFQNAIEEVVVPAAIRVYDRRRQQLGVDTLRPWDLDVDPFNRPPLRPFQRCFRTGGESRDDLSECIP